MLTDIELLYAIAMLSTGPQAQTSSSGTTHENAAFDPSHDPRTDPDHPLYRGP